MRIMNAEYFSATSALSTENRWNRILKGLWSNIFVRRVTFSCFTLLDKTYLIYALNAKCMEKLSSFAPIVGTISFSVVSAFHCLTLICAIWAILWSLRRISCLCAMCVQGRAILKQNRPMRAISVIFGCARSVIRKLEMLRLKLKNDYILYKISKWILIAKLLWLIMEQDTPKWAMLETHSQPSTFRLSLLKQAQLIRVRAGSVATKKSVIPSISALEIKPGAFTDLIKWPTRLKVGSLEIGIRWKNFGTEVSLIS